jgi:hypothetical protein
MATPESLKKAQQKAWSPEARAKAAATRKRNLALKQKGIDKEMQDRNGLLKHAKLTKKTTVKPKGIPLDMIPDPPTKSKVKAKPGKAMGATARQEVVLALLKYLNGDG